MDRYRRTLVQRNVDTILGEAENVAVLHVEVLAGEEPDTVQSASNSVEPQVTQNYHIIRSRLDHDAVGSSDQHRCDLSSAAINRDGFGDRQSSVARGIERVDLAARGSLRNCAGKRL